MNTRDIVVAVTATLSMVTAIALTCSPPSPRVHEATFDSFTLTYERTASERVSRTQFRYTFAVTITNTGLDALGVSASVSSDSAATSVLAGSLSFGDVPANSSKQAPSQLVLVHDRTVPFDPDILRWTVATTATVAPPPSWLSESSSNGVGLTSPETQAAIEALGPDAVAIPPDIAVQRVGKPSSLPLLDFVRTFQDNYFADYAAEAAVPVGRFNAYVLDDSSALVPRIPSVVYFIDVPPDVVVVSLQRQDAPAPVRAALDSVLESLVLREEVEQ